MVHRLLLLCLTVLVLAPAALPRPYRQKRPSDQRLSELASIVHMAHMNGLMELPVGMNVMNPDEMGRKRRSSEVLLQELLDREDDRQRAGGEEDPRWLSDMMLAL